MIKIAYCAGHGLTTIGKQTPIGEKEWYFNNIVAKSFALELANYIGVASKRFDDPTGKRDVPLHERTNGANDWGADYYISFHHNALRGVWGNHTGVETWIYTNPQSKSEELAKAIHPALVKGYGLTDRGIKKGNLHIVRETKMPAILLEGGFMDSSIDIVKLRDEEVLKNTGMLIAQAFAEFVGLKKNASIETIGSGTIISEIELVDDVKVTNPIKPSKPIQSAKPSTTAKKEKLVEDGYWGPATTRALQRHYGTIMDGVISGQPKNATTKNIPSVHFGKGGSQLIRAIQKDLGTTVDGVISCPSMMIKALQKHLGTIQDGKVSYPSNVVKMMQKALNNGTFQMKFEAK